MPRQISCDTSRKKANTETNGRAGGRGGDCELKVGQSVSVLYILYLPPTLAEVPGSPPEEAPISKARNPPPPNSGIRPTREHVSPPRPSAAHPPAQPPASQEGAADAASAVTDVNGAGAAAATSAVGDGDVSADDGAAVTTDLRSGLQNIYEIIKNFCKHFQRYETAVISTTGPGVKLRI